MRKKSGVGLGTVLVVVALVVTLGFALAGASVQHLNLQSRLTNAARAKDVARAAVNLGLERVLTNPDYGADTSADTLQEFTDHDGAVGRLTFNPGQAGRFGIPYSLNNLSGTEVKAGSTGQIVPLKTVHLVSVGTYRNVTRKVEVVLSLPPYPYAAASDGPISARQVIVGAVPPDAPLGMPAANLKLKPANLLSNANGGDALVLGENSTVSGDLMAKGGIKVDQRAQVKGMVRPNQEERELPAWKTDDYDPKLLDRPYIELQENYDANKSPADPGTTKPGEPTNPPGPAVKFSGTVRRQGNLNVEGDLNVEGAMVFVDGDMNVNGALTGKGVVVTTGNLTVRDHAEVDAHDKVALLAKKKLTLKGGGRSSSLITGILYSEGGFEASQLTLRGVVISRQGASGDKPVLFNGARVVKDPQAVTVTVAPTVDPGHFTILLRSPLPPYQEPNSATGYVLPRPGEQLNVPAEVVYGTANFPFPDGPLLYADVTESPGPEGEPLYSARLYPGSYSVNGTMTLADLAVAIGAETGISPRVIMALLTDAPRTNVTTTTTLAPSYTLTVKEPSQLLPFYQQARVVLWKEES